MDITASRSCELLFPTPIYVADYNNTTFCDEIAIAVKNIKETNQSMGDDLCWTSPDDLHLRPEFKKIADFLLDETAKVFDDIGLVRKSEYITCMWANISKPKNRHALHPHANSCFSGVFYLEAPGCPGNIGFKDPRPASEVLSFDYQDWSIFKNRTVEFEPKKGRLIIFPSWLYHGTKPGMFDENDNRISLAFNVMPNCDITDFSRRLSL